MQKMMMRVHLQHIIWLQAMWTMIKLMSLFIHVLRMCLMSMNQVAYIYWTIIPATVHTALKCKTKIYY